MFFSTWLGLYFTALALNFPLGLTYDIVSEDVIVKKDTNAHYILYATLVSYFGSYTITVSVNTYFGRILPKNDTGCPQKCQEPLFSTKIRQKFIFTEPEIAWLSKSLR